MIIIIALYVYMYVKYNDDYSNRNYKGLQYVEELQRRIAQRRKGALAPNNWPPAPRGVPVHILQAAYRRWRAYLVLKPIPKDQWAQLK